MAVSAKAVIGTGITITFPTSNWAGDITDIDVPNQKREAHDISTQATVGGRLYIPGKLTDNGELMIKGHFDPDLTAPMAGTNLQEFITVSFPLSNGGTVPATMGFQGFFVEFKATQGLDKVMDYDAKIKISGNITITPQS